MTMMAAVIVNHQFPRRGSRAVLPDSHCILKRVLSRLRYPVILMPRWKLNTVGLTRVPLTRRTRVPSPPLPLVLRSHKTNHTKTALTRTLKSRAKKKKKNSAKSWHLPNQQ